MRIGIDLGGTKIEGILLAGKKEIKRLRVDTPRGDYVTILQAIKGVVQDLDEHAGRLCKVGLGGPGSPNADGLMRNANTTELNGHTLSQDLESLLQRPVRISNDANCFVLAEALEGAAHEFASVFGIILGTGVGGGFVLNKQILIGANGIGGEWGHNPLPWMSENERAEKRQCYCGQSHCIETFLSGPGLAQSYLELSKQTIQARDILNRADQGDNHASAVLSRYEDQLARALAMVINILDPDCIVIGGGLSHIQRLYTNVPKLWCQYTFSDSVQTKLLAPLGGDSAGVKGAAWLWPEDH